MTSALSPHHEDILKRINFLVIGAQKAGTTWLDGMLRQHPDVFTPPQKEVHFFSKIANYDKGLAWYCEHFAQLRDEKAVGECTPNYIRTVFAPDEWSQAESDTVPQRVHSVLPDVKLIVSLRDPVERAISAYRHFVTRGNVSPKKRLRDVTHMFGLAAFGRYAENLEAWFETFERERFHFLIYEEDIVPDHRKLEALKQVYRFIGVDPDFIPQSTHERRNGRKANISAYLNAVPALRDRPVGQAVVERIEDLIPRFADAWFEFPIEQADRDALHEIYAPRQAQLESLLGRSLPWGRG